MADLAAQVAVVQQRIDAIRELLWRLDLSIDRAMVDVGLIGTRAVRVGAGTQRDSA